jgi:Flp pilus assembly protein CpaB
VRWPKGAESSAFVEKISEYQEYVSDNHLPKGLPIPRASLKQYSADINAVVENIPLGMRAITVRVDVESAVEGWARTGNYVDVIVISPDKNGNVGLESKVIAENVRILSAGRSTVPVGKESQTAQAPGTVTLLVTQADALKIKTAASIGRLTFSLRGQGDLDPTLARTMTQRELVTGESGVSKSVIRFAGKAVGPDGQGYVLTNDSEWLKATGSLVSLSSGELKEPE